MCTDITEVNANINSRNERIGMLQLLYRTCIYLNNGHINLVVPIQKFQGDFWEQSP
jgi:hypothetical protein